VALAAVLGLVGAEAASGDDKPSEKQAGETAGKAAEKPAGQGGAKPGTQIDASSGGVTIRSGDNSVTFGAYLQVRGTLDDREGYDADARGTAGFGTEDGASLSFDVPRVRLTVRGTMFRPWLRFNVAVEAGRTLGESDNKIKDAYLDVGKELASLRGGQFKIPFGLQELVPDWGQQFADRSIANSAFAPSRDVGAMLFGSAKAKKLGYSAGVFNGAGEARRQNNRAVMWAVRLWADPVGEYKLSEGAVEMPARSVLHLGVAARGGDLMRGGRAGVVQNADTQTAIGLELAWKRKAAFLAGETFWQTDQVHNPTAGPTLHSFGWHLQGSYMVIARRLELAGRFAVVDPDRNAKGDQATELRGGVNYYWKGHNLKLQSDVGRLTYEPSAPGRASATRLPAATGQELADLQVRAQLQLYF
jgi:phosphate-selective porin